MVKSERKRVIVKKFIINVGFCSNTKAKVVSCLSLFLPVKTFHCIINDVKHTKLPIRYLFGNMCLGHSPIFHVQNKISYSR